jgi:hypothetical protein
MPRPRNVGREALPATTVDDLIGLAALHVVVIARVERKEDAQAVVGIDMKDDDVAVVAGLDEQLDPIAAHVAPVLVIEPDPHGGRGIALDGTDARSPAASRTA